MCTANTTMTMTVAPSNNERAPIYGPFDGSKPRPKRWFNVVWVSEVFFFFSTNHDKPQIRINGPKRRFYAVVVVWAPKFSFLLSYFMFIYK
jgi:hypothetical protein